MPCAQRLSSVKTDEPNHGPPLKAANWDRGLRSLRTRRPPYRLDSRHCTDSGKDSIARVQRETTAKSGEPRKRDQLLQAWFHARLLRAAKCGSGAGNRVGPMSRWQEFKMLLLSFAISVGLTAAGALLAIGMAHL